MSGPIGPAPGDAPQYPAGAYPGPAPYSQQAYPQQPYPQPYQQPYPAQQAHAPQQSAYQQQPYQQQPYPQQPYPPQQPQPLRPPPGLSAGQQWPSQGVPAAAPRRPVDMAKVLPLTVGAAGVLNFIWGFLPAVGSGAGRISSYGSTLGWLPLLLLVGGLLGVGGLLPGTPTSRYPAAAVSVAGALGALFTLIVATGVSGVGIILMVIVGLIQAVVAVAAWLLAAGIMKQPAAASVAGQHVDGQPFAPVGAAPASQDQGLQQGYPAPQQASYPQVPTESAASVAVGPFATQQPRTGGQPSPAVPDPAALGPGYPPADATPQSLQGGPAGYDDDNPDKTTVVRF